MSIKVQDAKILETDEGIFILNQNNESQAYNPKYVAKIPIETFNIVNQFFQLFENYITILLDSKNQNGDRLYYEEDWHGQICNFLSKLMPEHNRVDIGNSLYSLVQSLAEKVIK